MIFIVQYLEADSTFVVTLYMVGGFLNWSSLQNKQQQKQNYSILDFTTPEHNRDVMINFKTCFFKPEHLAPVVNISYPLFI